MKVISALLLLVSCHSLSELKESQKHGQLSKYQSAESLIMCGYQAWFRAEGDGSNSDWVHFGRNRKFDDANCTIDLWPDVSEYQKLYDTEFKHKDCSTARVFSPYDASTVDLHFQWMREYGIDGVFVQRFFNVTKSASKQLSSNVILNNALEAAKENGRAIALMYDLSGMKADGEDCSSVIEDWKNLVDELKITNRGDDQTYLYHNSKPLVAIWGIGFPDRDYNIRTAGIDTLIDFLKNDPEYGGCSVLLGVPTYFRTLGRDCIDDPYLHELMGKSDIILPWTVGRYRDPDGIDQHKAVLKQDLDWLTDRKLNYMPVVFPGFSWYNLKRGESALNSIPRLKGDFYWKQMHAAISNGIKMIYVAMFDEIDEGTAIFKCTNDPPIGEMSKFSDYEGLPSDHYLWLTGEAGKMLRNEVPLSAEMPNR